MHIGIDGSRCESAKVTGVERYSSLIIPPLIKILKSAGHRVTVYTKNDSEIFRGAEVRTSGMRQLWTQLFLGPSAIFDKVDELFVPAHVLPFIRPKNSSVFLHDVCFEEYSSSYSFFSRWYLRLTASNSVRSSKIFTHSNYTKNLIIKIFGKGKIFVIPPAAISVGNYRQQLPWAKPYFICLGRIESKKNVLTLIRAYDQLLNEEPSIRHSLVFLGSNGYGAKEIMEAWNKIKNPGRIVFFGYADEKLKAQALREASGLLLPSYCEGTSLVLLEARDARLPFAATNCEPIREAGGQRGIYVTGNDQKMWKNAIKDLLHHPVVPELNMSRTWEEVAGEIADVLTKKNK